MTLSHPSSGEVTVQYSTGTDTTGDDPATADTDYTAVSNATLTISAGATSSTLTISTTEDIDEPDETFLVTLSNPSSNATLGSPNTATGTIVDDDDDADADADHCARKRRRRRRGGVHGDPEPRGVGRRDGAVLDGRRHGHQPGDGGIRTTRR